MFKIIAATLLSLSLAAPAFAFGPRTVVFDPAAELARTTGSAQFPESAYGMEQQARISQGGSQAFPQMPTGTAHAGVDVVEGGSSRFPVLNQDAMRHLPTAVAQDQALIHEFDEDGSAPIAISGDIANDIDG